MLAGGGGSSTRFHHQSHRVKLTVFSVRTVRRPSTPICTGTSSSDQRWTLRPTALLWTATDMTSDGHRQRPNSILRTGNIGRFHKLTSHSALYWRGFTSRATSASRRSPRPVGPRFFLFSHFLRTSVSGFSSRFSSDAPTPSAGVASLVGILVRPHSAVRREVDVRER